MSLFVLDTDHLTLYYHGDPIVVQRVNSRAPAKPFELRKTGRTIPANGQAPGSREVLLPPRPLRTAGDSFPSCSSSLHERPSRDAAALVRFFLQVDLSMAVDMEQLHVVTRVLTASAAPDAMDDAVAGDARWGSRPMAEHRVMARVLLSNSHYRSRRCFESQPHYKSGTS